MSAFCANTNVLDLVGLHADLEGTAINDARRSRSRMLPVSNSAAQTWPLTMAYVAASNGDYRAFLSAALPFIAKGSYTAVIDADGGANRFGHFEFRFKAMDNAVQDA